MLNDARTTGKPLALILLIVLACASGALAAEKKPDPMAPGLSGTQRLQALVDRVKVEQKELKSLEARFVQEQESAMLVQPEESSGFFSYAAPDQVRWEYTSPSPISVVIRGNEMTTWYKDLKRAEKVKIGRYSNQFFKYLGASGSMQTMLDYFTVRLTVPQQAGDPYQLELLPRYARISKRLKSMTLWIDADRFLPVRLKYVAADGDVTEYQFKDIKRNAPIPGERFVLNIPNGVETRIVDLDRGAKTKP
jgi:outer membrane lipoprotein carrier protein